MSILSGLLNKFKGKKNIGNFVLAILATVCMALYSRYCTSDDSDKKVEQHKKETKNNSSAISESAANDVDDLETKESKKESKRKSNIESSQSDIKGEKGFVAFIPDGDTVHMKDGQKVRLLGINCPEIYHDLKLGQRCAEEAKEYLTSLVKGKEITIKYQSKNKLDQYQRVLADVYVGDVWVNLKMIEEGFAFVYTTSENDLDEKLYAAESDAQKSKKGIWSKENDEELFNKFEPRLQEGELIQWVDKTILVEGQVIKCQTNKGAFIINIKTSSGAVVRSSISRKNFLHFPSLKESDYQNKSIAVIGRVSVYRGNPELTIRYPTQIYIKSPEK